MSDVRYLRLLPIAVAAIVLTTAIPSELRHPVWPGAEFLAADFAANVLLYVPLGLALHRRPWLSALLIGMCLSVVIEASQISMLGRYSSLVDVAANTGGTAAGFILGRWLVTRGMSPTDVPLRSLVGPAIVTLAVTGFAATPTTPSDLANWNVEFPLSLGNEQTGDRPWRGTITALTLTPGPPTRTAASAATPRAATQADTVGDSGDAYVLPAPVHLEGDAVTLSADAVQRFARAAMAQNGFTVQLRVASADLRQSGPARLVSFSQDQFNRNFDIGQEDRRLTFRVRTPATGSNGNFPPMETAELLEANREIVVTATYDGAIARLYVDGKIERRANLAAAGCPIRVLCSAGMPLARAAFAASVAIVALVLTAPRTRRMTAVVSLAALAVGAALLWLIELTLSPRAFPWWPTASYLVAGAGIVLAATSTRPGSGSSSPVM